MPSTRKKTTRSSKRSLNFDDDHDNHNLSPDIIDVDQLEPANPPSSFSQVTPSKKKQKKNHNKRNLDDYFKSPAKTPYCAADVNNKDSSVRSDIAVVTPPDEKRSKTVKEDDDELVEDIEENDHSAGENHDYIPTYLNKNIEYYRRGETTLDPMTKKVFDLVTKHYVVPNGFENCRSYGPKSGVSFEQRVIAAYATHSFQPKIGAARVQICTACATVGHDRDDCPELL